MLARAFLALSAFVVCLSTGFWLLYKNKQMLASSPPIQQEVRGLGADDTIFYRTIGQVPQSAKSLLVKSDAAAPKEEQYTLELAIAKSESEAQRMLARLEQKGVHAYYTPMQNNGRVIFRIRQGVYRQRELAAGVQAQLATASKITAKVVKLQ